METTNWLHYKGFEYMTLDDETFEEHLSHCVDIIGQLLMYYQGLTSLKHYDGKSYIGNTSNPKQTVDKHSVAGGTGALFVLTGIFNKKDTLRLEHALIRKFYENPDNECLTHDGTHTLDDGNYIYIIVEDVGSIKSNFKSLHPELFVLLNDEIAKFQIEKKYVTLNMVRLILKKHKLIQYYENLEEIYWVVTRG